MKRTTASTFVATLFALVFSANANAGQRYLIVLKSPQSMQAAEAGLANQGRAGANLAGPGGAFSTVHATVEKRLGHINTIVVNSSDAEIMKLKNSPDIATVEREIIHPFPRSWGGTFRPRKIQDNMKPGAVSASMSLAAPWGIGAVKAPQAWPMSNQGKGARVMVLDTGLDIQHPLIKQNFEKGQDFTDPQGRPSTDIRDMVGHGTHVSGTIAGVQIPSGFSGVAPQAKILMGRVCSVQGCSNIAVAQGIEWGIEEKVDVISMSLGGTMSTPAEKAAVAKAEEAGVSVVAAAGNDGTAVVGYPAALPTVVAVGAVDSNLKRADFSQYGPQLAVVAPGVNVTSIVPLGAGRESVVMVTMGGKKVRVPSVTFEGAKENTVATDVDVAFAGFGAPDEMAKANVAGKYVLVSRGGNINFIDKIKNAIQARATGVVVFNNAPGLIKGALTNDGSTIDMPVAMVLQETGAEMVKSLAANEHVAVSMVTVHTDNDTYDGTSMATPHVSGVVALIKAANKNLKPAQVKDILQKTAQKLGPNTKNEYGAGFVNAEAAVHMATGH
jgi:subtilisin family serine protease